MGEVQVPAADGFARYIELVSLYTLTSAGGNLTISLPRSREFTVHQHLIFFLVQAQGLGCHLALWSAETRNLTSNHLRYVGSVIANIQEQLLRQQEAHSQEAKRF